jgi:hypothetical protein
MRIRLPAPPPARHVLLATAVCGALLLIVAEFLTLREIRAVTAVPPGGRTTGGSHHLYAFALIGVAMIPMAVGAIHGRSRPAAIALLALAVTAIAITLLIDLPWIRDTGIIGRTYDLAEGHPAVGFWLQCAGAALVLASAVALLVRGDFAERPARSARRSSRGEVSRS